MQHKNLTPLPSNSYLNLVIGAQKILAGQAVDAAHGIDHHSRVNNFALDLILSEKIPVDWRTVSVACWWHDIEDKNGQQHTRLTQALEKERVDNRLQHVIIEAIERHSFFNSTQTSPESRILFDADKSEYLNPARLLYFSELVHQGLIDPTTATTYIKLWFDRMKTLESRLYFDLTRQYFQKYHQLAYQIMNKLK